jgi:acyl-CoA synthetase (AMP-forming)/AMP-acid ligase II
VLQAHCRQALAGYKVPKAFRWVDTVRRSPAGKPDYAWARDVSTPAGPAGPGEPGRSANSSVV